MTIRPALDPAWSLAESARVLWTQALGAAPSGPLVSAWVAMPAGALVIVLLAAHMRALSVAAMPESRRRIRTANGWVMLLATPVTAYAFGMATPADPRVFILSWLAVAGLLAIVLLLAGIDIVNTGRLNVGERRQMRDRLRGVARGGVPEAPDGDTRPPRDGPA